MIPNRLIDTHDIGDLIRKLSARKTIPTRFSISLPAETVELALAAAYEAEVRCRRRLPVLDDVTRDHIRMAARWLTDPHGKSGLMLRGLYGNGKTTLMLAICNLVNYLYDSAISTERVTIRIVDARDIARLGSRDETRDIYTRLYSEDLLAIDDLGEEPPEIISYGMVYTPVKDLLLERYRRQKLTIVSTNLINTASKPQLTEHYGARVVDRMREMMEIITFRNGSYRN